MRNHAGDMSAALSPEAQTTAERLAGVDRAITETAARAGRRRDEITLIAVSKRQSLDAISAAAAAGQAHFGENYLQEAVPKIEQAIPLRATWHYIGRIQSNKTQPIARHFDWVHTVDRQKIAERLSNTSQEHRQGRPLNLFLQVNVDADPNKAGVAPADVDALAEQIATLPGLRCRGLMTILDPSADPARSFGALRALFDRLAGRYRWDSLSMCMSGDFAAAIDAGATHLRIGTAVFGSRPTDARIGEQP